LSGTLADPQTITVAKNGSDVGTRAKVNYIEGSNVTLTVSDNSGAGRVDVTVAASSGGVSDGDKGDITVSSSGATWTIDNDAVTYAKIQDVTATARALGRVSSGSGIIEELTLSQILDFIGSAAQGDILYRGASAWARLGAGTSGHFLKTQGTGADPVWAAVSGSGLTQAYEGYNTIGGSLEVMTSKRVYAKKITLANDCLVTDIEAYLQNNAAGADDQVESFSAAIYADSAGTPSTLLQYATNDNSATDGPTVLLDSAAGSTGDGVGRWLGIPMGRWLTAGDYWLAVAGFGTLTVLQIAYDGSGSDRHYTSGGNWFADWGFYSPTTSSNKYSIRANTIR
jgi:hypothetical protein